MTGVVAPAAGGSGVVLGRSTPLPSAGVRSPLVIESNRPRIDHRVRREGSPGARPSKIGFGTASETRAGARTPGLTPARPSRPATFGGCRRPRGTDVGRGGLACVSARGDVPRPHPSWCPDRLGLIARPNVRWPVVPPRPELRSSRILSVARRAWPNACSPRTFGGPTRRLRRRRLRGPRERSRRRSP